MGWQTEVAVQLQAGDTIINPNGAFTYSSAPAAGNLIGSVTPAAGTDSFGNQYLQGVSAYGATFASSLNGGFLTLYTGSLAAGWTSQSTVLIDASGDLFLTAAAGKSVLTSNNTLDDGAGNMTVSVSLTVAGSTHTTINGVSSPGIVGTSGPASAGTAHTHSAGTYTLGSGQHQHSSFGG